MTTPSPASNVPNATADRELPVLDFSGWYVIEAHLFCRYYNDWRLKIHDANAHRDVRQDEWQTRIRENCRDNQPPSRINTGGELGVVLDSRGPLRRQLITLLCGLLGGVIGGVVTTLALR